MINKNKINLVYKKIIQFCRTVLDKKYFTKTMLLIIAFLLLVLIWLNRYSYSASVDSHDEVAGWRINNFTGVGCALSMKFETMPGIKTYKVIYDFSNCIKINRSN